MDIIKSWVIISNYIHFQRCDIIGYNCDVIGPVIISIISIISNYITIISTDDYITITHAASIAVFQIRDAVCLNLTQVRRNMFSHNSRGQVSSFCESNRTLVSFITARCSNTSWGDGNEHCTHALCCTRLCNDGTWNRQRTWMVWIRIILLRQHDKPSRWQHKFQSEREMEIRIENLIRH